MSAPIPLSEWPGKDDTVEIDGASWWTPLLSHAPRSVPGAELRLTQYKRGVYNMEGIGGYQYWQTRTRLPVASLRVSEEGEWRAWMVDDPLHWYGMREAVERLPTGTVACAGLGLGLMLHHLRDRDDVTQITVVERSQAVVDLISPTLPEDARVKIVVGDFYDHVQRNPAPDGVLWDLAVGEQEQTRPQVIVGQAYVGAFWPTTELVQFGLKP